MKRLKPSLFPRNTDRIAVGLCGHVPTGAEVAKMTYRTFFRRYYVHLLTICTYVYTFYINIYYNNIYILYIYRYIDT